MSYYYYVKYVLPWTIFLHPPRIYITLYILCIGRLLVQTKTVFFPAPPVKSVKGYKLGFAEKEHDVYHVILYGLQHFSIVVYGGIDSLFIESLTYLSFGYYCNHCHHTKQDWSQSLSVCGTKWYYYNTVISVVRRICPCALASSPFHYLTVRSCCLCNSRKFAAPPARHLIQWRIVSPRSIIIRFFPTCRLVFYNRLLRWWGEHSISIWTSLQ